MAWRRRNISIPIQTKIFKPVQWHGCANFEPTLVKIALENNLHTYIQVFNDVLLQSVNKKITALIGFQYWQRLKHP